MADLNIVGNSPPLSSTNPGLTLDVLVEYVGPAQNISMECMVGFESASFFDQINSSLKEPVLAFADAFQPVQKAFPQQTWNLNDYADELPNQLPGGVFGAGMVQMVFYDKDHNKMGDVQIKDAFEWSELAQAGLTVIAISINGVPVAVS